MVYARGGVLPSYFFIILAFVTIRPLQRTNSMACIKLKQLDRKNIRKFAEKVGE